MVEGPGVHRVAIAHKKALLGKVSASAPPALLYPYGRIGGSGCQCKRLYSLVGNTETVCFAEVEGLASNN